MTQEYDEGPWVELPDGALVELGRHTLGIGPLDAIRYRILTPKPRREFVVGKWYAAFNQSGWRRCLAIEPNGDVWLVAPYASNDAVRRTYAKACEVVDWSAFPRDEAPE